MSVRPLASRAAATLPLWLTGVLLFVVSGTALHVHMAVVHPERWYAEHDDHAHHDHHEHDEGEAPAAPYDHSRSCDAGHMLHGLAATLTPPAAVHAPFPLVDTAAPEGSRPVALDSHLSLRSRAPPAAQA